MSDVYRALDLFRKGDWPSFVSFCASLTDAQWRALLIGRYSGATVVGYVLGCNPPHAAWLTVKAAADRLGVQILSQPDDINSIPLHYALEKCSVVAVVSSVIEGTPPTMLHRTSRTTVVRLPSTGSTSVVVPPGRTRLRSRPCSSLPLA